MAVIINRKLAGAVMLQAALMMSPAITAGTVVVKPGAPMKSSEFGSALARSGNYTVVGASQETVALPNEPIKGGNDVGGQGVVYLFNGTSTTPERRYQFAGNAHFFKKAGVQVAISNKWLAFGTMEDFANTGNPSAVYIVGKTNGQWTQCPTVNGVLDCTTWVKANGAPGTQPILRIDLPGHVDPPKLTLAISDDYLVMGDQSRGEIFVYRYSATDHRWIHEHTIDGDPTWNMGAAVAIEGDKIAISAPNAWNGFVRIYKRLSTGIWDLVANASGSFTGGHFGRFLDMHSGNLVAGSGQAGSDNYLAFYPVDANGRLGAREFLVFNEQINRVAVSDNTAIVTTQDPESALRVFQRNTNSGTWSQTATLDRQLYIGPTGSPYYSADPIDLVGDDVLLGWRAHNGNIGAFIREKVSLIDSCKSTRNLMSNCSFDNNSGSGWQFLMHQGASASVNYNSSQLNAAIYNPGSVHWHIQARTAVNLSAGGHYQLRFRAKAPAFRDITVNLGHNGNQDNNWLSYGQVSFRPGPEWTQYVYEFYGLPSDANAFLDFNLGNAGTTSITIDGVSLTPLDI